MESGDPRQRFSCRQIARIVPIDSFNSELIHAKWFFHGYICDGGHALLKCLKCGEVMQTDYCETHVGKCYFKRPSYTSGAATCTLSGEPCYIDLYDVTRNIPHALCLDIDYNDPKIIRLFDEKTKRIDDGDMNIFTELLNALIKQTPSCYFCGFDYDCFPTELMFTTHCMGCVGFELV